MLRILLLLLVLNVSACADESAMSPAKLAASIEAGKAPLVLDVRTQEEYEAGHVPGAVLIPYDQIETRIAELGEPRALVVYCKSGRRSGLAETVLKKHGFTVQQLDGSWQAWQAAKLPEEVAKAH